MIKRIDNREANLSSVGLWGKGPRGAQQSQSPQGSCLAIIFVQEEDSVFPVEPQRPNGKNINLHKKWGFRRFQKERQKVPKSAENRTFCAKSAQKSAQKVRFSALFGTFWRSFWNRRKPQFLCRLMFLPFGLWGSTGNTQFKKKPGEMKVSTSTVAALFSKMSLTGQRIAMVDMIFLVFTAFHIYRRGGWSQSLPLKIFLFCSLGSVQEETKHYPQRKIKGQQE